MKAHRRQIATCHNLRLCGTVISHTVASRLRQIARLRDWHDCFVEALKHVNLRQAQCGKIQRCVSIMWDSRPMFSRCAIGGISSAMLMAAAVLCMPHQANAAQVIATVTGTVTYGIDGQTGGGSDSSIFGFPPGTQMAGSPYTAVYTLDTVAGVPFDAQTPCINSRKSSGLNNTPVPKAEITINGKTYALGTSTPTGVASYVQAYGAPASKPENSLVFQFSDSGPSPKTETLYTDISLNSLSQYVCRNWADAFSYTLQSSDQPSSGNFDAIVPSKGAGSSNQYSFAYFNVKTVTVGGPITTPHIYFASPTGKIDVTNRTQTVVVGQPIQLTAVQAGSTQSQPWSDPGDTVGSFTVAGKIAAPCDGAACAPGKTVAADFTNQNSTTFYWIAPNNDYTIEYRGTTGTAKATFNVVGPDASSVSVTVTPSITEAPGGVHIVPPSMLLFGYKPGVPGISFQANVIKPIAHPGNFLWVQLIDYDIQTSTAGNGVRKTCEYAPRGGLDNSYPYTYPPDVFTDNTNDTPKESLDSAYVEEQRTFSASMYLMWEPSGIPGSIPVPLGSVQGYEFVGDAQKTSSITNTWQLKSGAFFPKAPPAAQPPPSKVFNFSVAYPRWSEVSLGVAQPPC